MTAPRQWTGEAKNLRAIGLSYEEIGRQIGRNESTVWRALNPQSAPATKAATAAWVKANPEAVRNTYRKWEQAHRKERTDYHREQRDANREAVRERDRAYYQAHKAEKIATVSQRRARKRTTMVAADSENIAAVYRVAATAPVVKCYLCGRTIPKKSRQVDHVHPLARGGAHSSSNLAVACARCNHQKGAKLPHEVGLLL